MGNTAKRSIIGGALNLPYADWNGHAEVSRGPQASLNTLVWESGYAQVVEWPYPRGCVAGRLPCPARKFVQLLQYRTGDQRSLRGVTGSGMGRKMS